MLTPVLPYRVYATWLHRFQVGQSSGFISLSQTKYRHDDYTLSISVYKYYKSRNPMFNLIIRIPEDQIPLTNFQDIIQPLNYH